MNRVILSFAVLLLSCAPAWSGEVPRCWESEDPAIDDGVFVVTLSTEDLSAQDVAAVLFELTAAAATQRGVSSDRSLDRIVLEAKSPDLSLWRPSLGFPTLESVKQWTLKSLEPILALKGVRSIKCHRKSHRHRP